MPSIRIFRRTSMPSLPGARHYWSPRAELRVIRAATRSAYADVCALPELGAANYKAMIAREQGIHKWTPEQLQMIDALYIFAVSYFTGNAKITDDGSEGASDGQAGETREAQSPPPPKCPPEQKQKVESAIKAYVASVGAN